MQAHEWLRQHATTHERVCESEGAGEKETATQIETSLWLYSREMLFSQEGGIGEESQSGRTRAKVAGLHTKAASRAKVDARARKWRDLAIAAFRF